LHRRKTFYIANIPKEDTTKCHEQTDQNGGVADPVASSGFFKANPMVVKVVGIGGAREALDRYSTPRGDSSEITDWCY